MDMLAAHPDCYFQIFTNGQLIDDSVAKELRRLGNATPLISVEGDEIESDKRRLEVAEAGVQGGLCVVFCQHTSASLLIQENASRDAAADLMAWLERIAPDGDRAYTHADEGPDDMPAHLRSAVTKTSETIPIVDGRLALGTWQGLFLVEHRLSGSNRNLVVHVAGD
jgi:secondary thiamine-phosphate synthase enzyme